MSLRSISDALGVRRKAFRALVKADSAFDGFRQIPTESKAIDSTSVPDLPDSATLSELPDRSRNSNEIDENINDPRANVTMAPALGFTFITVYAGSPATQEERRFVMHEDLLKSHSDYFHNMIDKMHRDNRSRILRLPEVEPESFELFTHFLYQARIFSQNNADLPPYDNLMPDPELQRLVKAYTFAEKVKAVDFGDAVIDTIVQKLGSEKKPPAALHQLVYPKTTNGSPIRRLLVDIAVWYWDGSAMEKVKKNQILSEFHLCDFFLDLAVAFAAVKSSGLKGRPPYEESTCAYHHHKAAGMECYRKNLAGQRTPAGHSCQLTHVINGAGP